MDTRVDVKLDGKDGTARKHRLVVKSILESIIARTDVGVGDQLSLPSVGVVVETRAACHGRQNGARYD